MKRYSFYFALLAVSAFIAVLASCGSGEIVDLSESSAKWGEILEIADGLTEEGGLISRCKNKPESEGCNIPTVSSSSEDDPSIPSSSSANVITEPSSSSNTITTPSSSSNTVTTPSSSSNTVTPSSSSNTVAPSSSSSTPRSSSSSTPMSSSSSSSIPSSSSRAPSSSSVAVSSSSIPSSSSRAPSSSSVAVSSSSVGGKNPCEGLKASDVPGYSGTCASAGIDDDYTAGNGLCRCKDGKDIYKKTSDGTLSCYGNWESIPSGLEKCSQETIQNN